MRGIEDSQLIPIIFKQPAINLSSGYGEIFP